MFEYLSEKNKTMLKYLSEVFCDNTYGSLIFLQRKKHSTNGPSTDGPSSR